MTRGDVSAEGKGGKGCLVPHEDGKGEQRLHAEVMSLFYVCNGPESSKAVG